MRIAVLGPTEAWFGPTPVDLGARKQRALLAALVLHRGRAVPVDTLVDLLWGEHPPAGVGGTLQVYVSGLRRALEPERPARAPARVLVTVGTGYAVRLPEPDVDVAAFEATVDAVHRDVAAGRLLERPRLREDELAAHHDALGAALATWRGTPFADLDDAAAVQAERARLEQLLAVALEDRASLGLALGRHATVAAELEALTAAYPLRERLWALRAVALARSGRQADALDTLRRVRQVLAGELGLEPGAELREVQAAVLRQDPVLDWRPPAAAGAGAATPQPEAGSAAAAAGERASSAAPPTQPSWPLAGRSAELAALRQALDDAVANRAGFVSLVGEPGIGKSRLAGELVAIASRQGARVAEGRCSQDEGAPPLWPWQQVLRALHTDLEASDAQDEGAQFRTWEAIVGAVLGAARTGPLLVVLDDLHWADVSTLRVVRLLADTATDERLLVVMAWRAFPPPAGALADLAETLARRHATRLALRGVGASDAAAIVGAVTDHVPTDRQAQALTERTEGNPFFLVEYARLARERGDLSALLAEPNPPSAVQDVLLRRLHRLPAGTLELVRVAAVCGREFDLATLAAAAALDEDAALDLIDPALAAGLVREDGVGHFVFAHALVRDTAYGSIPVTRRARRHARVAATLEGAGRESEAARHWLAAGPQHAARAWRAARAAADAASALHAHEQAAGLLGSALDAAGQDPQATAQDRFDLLMALADAHRWAGMWEPLRETVEAAIDVADGMGDLRLLGCAASAMTIGALWQSAPYGSTHPVVIAALRRCVAGLPATDDPLRCRVLLSLANELYYGSSFEERLALVEQALAMAHRLGDDDLLLDAYQNAFVSLWCPRTLPDRLRYATEALELAKRVGNERVQVIAATLVAVAHGELGELDAMSQAAASARTSAIRLRLPYALIVLDGLELPWLAMAGRFEEAQARLTAIQQLVDRISVPHTGDAVVGALVSVRIWQGRTEESVSVLAAGIDGPLPLLPVVLAFALRTGDPRAARALASTHAVTIDFDDWMSLLAWGCAAEAAAGLGDADLAARAYAYLAPYAGRVCCAGSTSHLGPVDAFLALAAAATGEVDLARTHAAAAEGLLENWRIPLAARWFHDQRDRLGF